MKLFIIPSWYPTKLSPDNGTFFVEWAGTLARGGFEVVIIANIMHTFKKVLKLNQLPEQTADPVIEQGLVTYRREFINPFPKLRRASYLFYRHRLNRHFKAVLHQQGRPDAVLIHSSVLAGAALAEHLAAESLPFVVTEHHKKLLLPGGFRGFLGEGVRKSYRHAGKVVAVSTALERRLCETYPEARGKTTVIHNPVPKHFQNPDGGYRGAGGEFTFIAVALLRSEKRIDLLLKAFIRLVGDDNRVRLILVGDGPLRGHLERLAQRRGLNERVEFTGYLPAEDVVRQLRRSHCLVLPSEVETFGLALVEAMACGLPVIATRCGGPEDIVTDETGILIPVNDELALYRAMATMLQSHDKYDGQQIRRYALEKFGAERYTAAFTAVFNELTVAR